MFDYDYIIIQHLLEDKTAKQTFVDFSTVHKILRRKLVKRMTVTVQRIVDLTERYGTSGAFIARLCGKSRSLIAGWKDGKAAPTDSDLAAIADLYGVSVAYLRGEVDVPESSVKNALQQQLLDSVQSLADDEMLKVIEYVRFLKFLDAEQKADPQ